MCASKQVKKFNHDALLCSDSIHKIDYSHLVTTESTGREVTYAAIPAETRKEDQTA